MPSCRQPPVGVGSLTVAEVLRAGINQHTQNRRLPLHHWKVLRALMACRTPALGGHWYQCHNCGEEHFVPHSCRNRHCPSCQGANGFDWLDKQSQSLLPIPYFHLVFTLPHQLNPLIQQNRARLYDLLFDSVSAMLLDFGRNHLRAQIGVTSVLHTWSQTLLDHYHLHCIVTGGGLQPDGGWNPSARHWLFPVRALSKVFRGKFCTGLEALFHAGQLEFHGQLKSLAAFSSFQQLLHSTCRKNWVVYSKRPFAGPDAVLAYLSRYTHRVGMTNHRLRHLDATAKTVTFEYKDYADDSRKKLITLELDEFIRRFRLHILPERFVKIRHYGLLANRNRNSRISQSRIALNVHTSVSVEHQQADIPATSPALPVCPHCRQPALVLVKITRPHKVSYHDSS